MTNKPNETDLVDVGELPHGEEVTEAKRRMAAEDAVTSPSGEPTEVPADHAVDDPFALQMEPSKPGQATIASLRERLAAFLVDVGVLWLLYWGCLWLFHKLTTRSWIGSVPTMGYNSLLFHGIFMALAFLYFFLLEAAFFATIGKFCCWMYVRRKDGRPTGVFCIFIRNFFRLIELLTAGLSTWIPMELSHRHQRLGDMAAGTIVIKKHSASTRYYPLDPDTLASAFGRLFASVVDMALVLIWLVGYVMLINYQSLYLSQWLVIFFPVLFILFWTLVQMVMEGSPGLWLLGYTVTHEDGGRLTFAGALIRALLAPLDLFLGLPCMLLGLRKQKIGDMMAATVVSRQRRRWKGAISSLVVIALSVGLVALGLFVNPVNNAFKAGADFKLSFMPLVEGLPDWESAANAQPPVLTVRNFRFGVNDPNTRRTPPVYEAGETIYIVFELLGYARKDRLVWIQEDLVVQYPDGTIGMRRENAIDYHQLIRPGGAPIELSTPVVLPPNAPPGTYVVTVTLRDMLANINAITETQSFMVKAPPSMTSPLEALPPAKAAPVDTYSPSHQPALGGGEGATTSTVPSSPIPVIPAAASPEATSAPTPAATPAPAGGFTVLPGPSIEPKQEVAPVPSIPVPPPTPPPPADQYGSKAVTPASPTPAVVPPPPADRYGSAAPAAPIPTVAKTPPAVTAAAPPPATPAIVEKTLTPTDVYGKPGVSTAPAMSAAPSPAAAPAAAPVKESAKTPTPSKGKTKAPKAPVDQELKKEAEKELQKVAPAPAAQPAKPAADIPSALDVKKQSEQAPTKPKKKKVPGGGSSGGYIP